MHPNHELWDEFIDRLWDAIDFEWEEGSDFKSTCVPSTHIHCREILIHMDADAEASIAHFKNNGGGCDCEVIVNMELLPKADRDNAERN